MDAPPFDAEAWLATVAPALGLAIDPAYRPGVLTFLRLSADHAATVMAFDLPEEIEPAPVFHA